MTGFSQSTERILARWQEKLDKRFDPVVASVNSQAMRQLMADINVARAELLAMHERCRETRLLAATALEAFARLSHDQAEVAADHRRSAAYVCGVMSATMEQIIALTKEAT